MCLILFHFKTEVVCSNLTIGEKEYVSFHGVLSLGMFSHLLLFEFHSPVPPYILTDALLYIYL